MPKKLTPEGWPDHVGDRGHFHDPGDSVRYFTIIDEIRQPESGAPSKVIYLQLMKFDNGKLQLRLCYYIQGKVGRPKGKWVFGQFATLLPSRDFQEIIAEAKSRNWI